MHSTMDLMLSFNLTNAVITILLSSFFLAKFRGLAGVLLAAWANFHVILNILLGELLNELSFDSATAEYWFHYTRNYVPQFIGTVLLILGIFLVYENAKNQNDSVTPLWKLDSSKKLLFSFNGRVNRRVFWGVSAVTFLLSLYLQKLIFPNLMDASQSLQITAGLVLLVLSVPLFWITLAIQVKRWHDLGRSGWMVLINLIPLLGALYAMVMLGFIKGSSQSNQFGKSPDSLPEA